MNPIFSKSELFILALILDREAIAQILRDPRFVADLLIAELRITMLEESVLLTNSLGQDAADPDCPDNLSLFSKLRSVDQQSMPELIAAIEHQRCEILHFGTRSRRTAIHSLAAVNLVHFNYASEKGGEPVDRLDVLFRAAKFP